MYSEQVLAACHKKLMFGQVLQSQWVWYKPKDSTKPTIGGQVTHVGTKSVTVVDDDGKKHEVSDHHGGQLSAMDQSCVDSVEDMIMLGDLHEAAVLRNIERRFKNRDIYTYTGAILVAVNPYQVLPIYTADDIDQYRNKRFGELPPHIFAIADNAFSNMKRFDHNQCILISGESGAGKTETTKLLVQFLAAVSGQHSWIEQQIIESNPVLEAFGNAKTVRNNNSSRFGKYINITFDQKGCIQGAKIQQYLLEKSRIVSQQNDERNYHIFYCLLHGMTTEEKKILNLEKVKDYHYTNQGSSKHSFFRGSKSGDVKTLERDDARDFGSMKSAMAVLNFSDDDKWAIFKLLAALLHLGNLKYQGTTVHHTDATVIENRESITYLAQELLVSESHLVSVLTTKTIETTDGPITINLDQHAALDVRDAFVKGLYGRLFDWIVEKINKTIDRSHESPEPLGKSIGLLDIFGFESFTHNSFEQLCINYANENLQQFFVQHIFHLEQAEYKAEGILWKSVNYGDNTESLDLLVTHRLSIFNLVDEESRFPKGSDKSLLTKLHMNHESNPLYTRPKGEARLQFGVTHYAGTVIYTTKGFVEKNRDTFSQDLLEMVKTSKSNFLLQLFENDAQKSGYVVTLGSQFRQSLHNLMETLHSCQPFFVRCIKPNVHKKPMVFDRELCLQQIQYAGLMETVCIRRNGYPIRHTFAEFIDRYRIIAKFVKPSHLEEDVKGSALKICKEVLENDDFQLGTSKVFLKDGQDAYLEQQRDRYFNNKIIYIQKILRGYVQRSKTAKLMEERREEMEQLRHQRAFQLQQSSDNERENMRRRSSVFVMSPQQRRVSYFPTPSPTQEQVSHQHYDQPSNGLPTTKSTVSAPHYQPVFQYNWHHTPKPIMEPLLDKIKRSEALSEVACGCFDAIIKYIGDAPHRSVTVTELTDLIFDPPINYEILRDEIYCQVMMQLNNNNREESIQKCWELMWLMTGLFAPSEKLQHETKLFLERKKDDKKHRNFATSCHGRVQKTLDHGSSRKYPPHEVEVKAIQQKVTKLLYNIYFPDDTCAQVAVDSSSRARDVVTYLARDLKLKSSMGFSLFLKAGDRVVSIPNRSFVFDVGRQWVKKLEQVGVVPQGGQIQLIFLKKLWTTTEPGKDRVADVKFHFPQELPKYLSGYHQCSKEDALQLAAFILKVKYGNSAKTQSIQSLLKELAPAYIINKIPAAQWQKAVVKIYQSLRHRTTDDAKMMFLKVTENWKTFGSAFFMVKQLSNPRNPSNVLLAVSPEGVHIIHPLTKEILETHSFQHILVWSCDARSFHMTTGNVMNSTKFLCQTSLGYKIDDLLTSYKRITVERKDYARILRRDSMYPTTQITQFEQEPEDDGGNSTDL